MDFIERGTFDLTDLKAVEREPGEWEKSVLGRGNLSVNEQTLPAGVSRGGLVCLRAPGLVQACVLSGAGMQHAWA